MQKMQRTNQKVRAWMLTNKYEDIKFFPHTRFSKDYHFQGQEFDGISSHNDKIVIFQCKTNTKATKQKLREYEALSKKFNAEFLWFNAPDRKPIEINNIAR